MYNNNKMVPLHVVRLEIEFFITKRRQLKSIKKDRGYERIEQ